METECPSCDDLLREMDRLRARLAEVEYLAAVRALCAICLAPLFQDHWERVHAAPASGRSTTEQRVNDPAGGYRPQVPSCSRCGSQWWICNGCDRAAVDGPTSPAEHEKSCASRKGRRARLLPDCDCVAGCTCNAAAPNYDPGDCAVHGPPELQDRGAYRQRAAVDPPADHIALFDGPTP